MIALLAELSNAETDDLVTLIVLLLALVSLGIAVWRAYLRDVLGTVVAGVLGLILLFVAL